MLNLDLDLFSGITRTLAHTEETEYLDGVMIMINMSTEFGDSRTYPTFEDSRDIKMQMLKDKRNIYDNTRHLLLSWWEQQSCFNSVSAE